MEKGQARGPALFSPDCVDLPPIRFSEARSPLSDFRDFLKDEDGIGQGAFFIVADRRADFHWKRMTGQDFQHQNRVRQGYAIHAVQIAGEKFFDRKGVNQVFDPNRGRGIYHDPGRDPFG
jgi:hypothetical protein